MSSISSHLHLDPVAIYEVEPVTYYMSLAIFFYWLLYCLYTFLPHLSYVSISNCLFYYILSAIILPSIT